MSQDAGSYALESDEPQQRTNWRELEVQKWQRKKEMCPSLEFGICYARPSVARCLFASCPFVYWGCL